MKNIISAEQFDYLSIKYVMDYATRLDDALQILPEVPLMRGKLKNVRDEAFDESCFEGKVLSNCFLECSTRTSSSFHAAMLKLGGTVLSLNQESSVQKGETLEDTVRMMEAYSDLIVLRHPTQGSADLAASVLTKLPLLNAGDGGGEHPTQALLDLFCIHRRFGSLDEPLSLTLLGDLKFGRTVHSLAQMISHFPNFKLNLVSPPNLRMPQQYLDLLELRKCKYEVYDDLQDVLPRTDVLYQTRVQKERFEDKEEYNRSRGLFVVTKETMRQLKDSSILMHPLPRVDEITEEVDEDPRAMYFKQPMFGVRVRMALLALVMGNETILL